MTETYPNPDLAVGAVNKQRWNQPAHRRHGFHNAHQLFRRTVMMRSRNVLRLDSALDATLQNLPEVRELLGHTAFSALVVARGDRILLEASAADFAPDCPHSIQSVSKLHINLIVGWLLEHGRIDLGQTVRHFLPGIGSGYAEARIQDLLDMNVTNDFTEDYADPQSDCYTEEIALGWRLPDGDRPETTLLDFACGITGDNPENRTGFADYKSANTDVLTLICQAVSPVPLLSLVEGLVDAAGYEGGFHVSLSPEHVPAFSGGVCLSTRDLARFGLLFVRGCSGREKSGVVSRAFLETSLTRLAPRLRPPKDWLRYSNHLMTDGRLIVHTGYGGQVLLVDLQSGTSCAYLSVLENESGYDEAYMVRVIRCLRVVAAWSGLQNATAWET